jgi:DNA-directed RNA polymerase specialized sigma24 family protein
MKQRKSEIQLLSEINRKLDILIAAVSSQDKEKIPQAKLLRKQFKPAEIADILGTTPNTVRVMLHRAGKKTQR